MSVANAPKLSDCGGMAEAGRTGEVEVGPWASRSLSFDQLRTLSPSKRQHMVGRSVHLESGGESETTDEFADDEKQWRHADDGKDTGDDTTTPNAEREKS